MLLTIFYTVATFIRSMKIRSFRSLISANYNAKCGLIFYNISNEEDQELDEMLRNSLVSKNYTNYSEDIPNLIWVNEKQKGFCISSLQKLDLKYWILFSNTFTYLPFTYEINVDIDLDDNSLVYLMLEIESTETLLGNTSALFKIQNFGEIIAWKVNSRLSLLLKTDILHLIEFISCVYLENQTIDSEFIINRAETVEIYGYPLSIEHIAQHSGNCIRKRNNTESKELYWQYLNSISQAAQQAAELSNIKEGQKLNVVQPDLIASNNIEKSCQDLHKSIPKINHELSIAYKESETEKEPETKKSPLRVSFKENLVSHGNYKEKNELGNSSRVNSPTPPPDTKPPTFKNSSNDIPSTNTTVLVHDSPTATTIIPQRNNVIPAVNDLSNINTSATTSTIRPKLKRTKGSLTQTKPANVLVYSDSSVAREHVITTLNSVLDRNKFTIYPLTVAEINLKIWSDNTSLLVVCGNVTQNIGTMLLDYFLNGGKMLCLCSDLLHVVLPTYRTAEVRENELVRFSYNKWKNVKMMHHIFCYQPSPVKKHFSHDSDEVYTPPNQPKMMCPRSIEVKDLQGLFHNLNVKVLGTEETWNTPSLMLAESDNSSGKVVFSQVHLETDPNQFENDESKFSVLKENETARLEILSDILNSCLEVPSSIQNLGPILYECGYFLGKHDIKLALLERLKSVMNKDYVIDNGKMILKFIGKNDTPPKALSNFLPIMLHSCPDDFSTIEYFDNLKTENVGRLVIYCPITTSSMNILHNLNYVHGLVVIPKRQTQGEGRNKNQWISPDGCLMFSIQLHIPLKTAMGSRLPLLQHLFAISMTRGILNLDGCKNLKLSIKWPNDIYVNETTKIGGLITNCKIDDTIAICNAGCGINLKNSVPTTCVYDVIKQYNLENNENIPFPSYEKVMASIFNEIEYLYEQIQNNDDIDILYKFYYQHWLHSDTEVMVFDKKGVPKRSKVIGIDDFGYLSVQVDGNPPESVHPDGNSFDILRGLIFPKYD